MYLNTRICITADESSSACYNDWIVLNWPKLRGSPISNNMLSAPIANHF